MPEFTNQQKHNATKQFVRGLKESGTTDVPVRKDQLWGAVQAVRDVIDSPPFRSAVNTAIDGATAPVVLPQREKVRLTAYAMLTLAIIEG